MQQTNIQFSKSRQVDDVVSDSIDFLKQNFKPLLRTYFTICGLFVVASMVMGIVHYFQMRAHIGDVGSMFSIAYLIYVFFSMMSITALFVTTLSYLAVYRDKQNQTPTVEEVWGYFKYYFLKSFGVLLIIFIISCIGLIFCAIPGIYLFTVLSLMLPIIILENTTIGYAFDRCFQIIKNSFWTVFGSMFVMSIILTAAYIAALIPVMLFVQLFAMISGSSFQTLYYLPMLVLSHAIQFLYVLPIIALAFNYFSLTEQREGTSLRERIEAFGTVKEQKDDNSISSSEEY
ncbi:hypothetical protein [Mucilaginibacter terrae]|uniref:Glycerophosphoryl diester phosphodiesterase membrane domain-containing protein n=1 Tax=Mucilaginibacter terrae TaxID=1955052 RepID=A0ABU3H0P5_9SPHI|nr:hypothetical protein [Mucilaginibacter terrae]MDT3405261.1 hypothetical protein [Mucilaginibacter terrae]